MIIEHEVLEQIAESSFDWPLIRALEFVARFKDPWLVFEALHQDNCITLHYANGAPLERWRIEEIFRNRGAIEGDVVVKVTRAGITRANY